MELIELAEVDSTSTRAAALLASGKKAPFAVLAHRQTAGRGRRGHGWESPPGNLYMTMALPPSPVPPARQGLFPLKAGVLIAERVQRAAGVRPTLKWPNDLLFGGRKLGGLLLESSTTGQATGDVLIGVGLNLNGAPAIMGPYRATSLHEIVGAPQDVAAWARTLTQGFADDWNGLSLDDVPRRFEALAIGEGHVWARRDGGEARRCGIPAADGTLALSPLSGGDPLPLSSTDHPYAWIHLGEDSEPLVLADVGNSSVKLRLVEVLRLLSPQRSLHGANVVADSDVDAFAGALAPFVASRPRLVGMPLHILSVNPPAAARLAEAARRVGLYPLPVPKRRLLSRAGGYDLLELGVDRLAAVEGYLATRRAMGDARIGVVVQAGTATTIDVVHGDGTHAGGLILPGLRTALDALHRVGALLPALAPERADRGPLVLGHDTASAMLEGARHLIVGAVERVAHDAGGGRRPVEIVVTGGHADWVATALGAAVEGDLALKGLGAMVLGGYAPVRINDRERPPQRPSEPAFS